MMAYRCPEPKPVAILVLAAAGAVSGLLITTLSLPEGTSDEYWVLLACWGLGIGLAIAVSAALSTRRWVRMASAPVLVFAGQAVALSLGYAAQGARTLNWRDFHLQTIKVFVLVGIPISLAMLVAHEFMVRSRKTPAALALYASLGVLSGVIVWLGWLSELRSPFVYAMIGGAVFGLCQFFGMLAALAFDKKIRRL